MWSDDPADLVPVAAGVLPIAQRAGDRVLALEARMALVGTSDIMSPDFLANAVEAARLAHELDRPDIENRALRLQAIAANSTAATRGRSSTQLQTVAINHGLDEPLGWVEYLRAEFGFGFGLWSEAVAAGLRAVDLGERHAYHRVAVRSWLALVADRGVAQRWPRPWRARIAWFRPQSRGPPGFALRPAPSDGHRPASRVARAWPPPDVSPERMLPSFNVDPSSTWLEAADIIIRTWLSRGGFSPRSNRRGRDDALGSLGDSGPDDEGGDQSSWQRGLRRARVGRGDAREDFVEEIDQRSRNCAAVAGPGGPPRESGLLEHAGAATPMELARSGGDRGIAGRR